MIVVSKKDRRSNFYRGRFERWISESVRVNQIWSPLTQRRQCGFAPQLSDTPAWRFIRQFNRFSFERLIAFVPERERVTQTVKLGDHPAQISFSTCDPAPVPTNDGYTHCSLSFRFASCKASIVCLRSNFS